MLESAPSRRMKALGLLGGGVAAGIIAAGAFNAGAATTSGNPTTAAAVSPSTAAATAPSSSTADAGGHRGAGGHNPDEKSVTAAQAATLKAAALAKVPGATVDRVETDSGDAAYEVHMTKADGSEVTVKFDKNLAFVAVEDGMGK